MYAAKLKNQITITNFQERKFTHAYSPIVCGAVFPDNVQEFKGVKFFEVTLSSQNRKQILSVIPIRYVDNFDYLLLKINNNVPPHIDEGIISQLLFYIQPANCVTQFYEYENPEGDRTQQLAERKLINKQSFVAEPNDCWILNIEKPHSVTYLNDTLPRQERIAISMFSHKYTFNDVCEMLYETGNL